MGPELTIAQTLQSDIAVFCGEPDAHKGVIPPKCYEEHGIP